MTLPADLAIDTVPGPEIAVVTGTLDGIVRFVLLDAVGDGDVSIDAFLDSTGTQVRFAASFADSTLATDGVVGLGGLGTFLRIVLDCPCGQCDADGDARSIQDYVFPRAAALLV